MQVYERFPGERGGRSVRSQGIMRTNLTFYWSPCLKPGGVFASTGLVVLAKTRLFALEKLETRVWDMVRDRKFSRSCDCDCWVIIDYGFSW